MCRCCQSCLEDLYWNCIEEKFCFDKSIAEYNPDEDEFVTKNNIKIIANGQDNNNQTPIRSQPVRRNESSIFSNAKIHEEDVRREIQTSVPILAPEIIAVFNNSQIFQDSQKMSRVNTKNAITPIHSPTATSAREKQMASEQKKLIFQLEGITNIEPTQTISNTTNITSETAAVPIEAAGSSIITTSAIKNNDQNVTETLNSNNVAIEKKIKFTIADNAPLELINNNNKSPNGICPIIPEKDEDETDDAATEIASISDDNQNKSINSLNRFSYDDSSKNSSINKLEIDDAGEKEEVLLRPKFKVGGDNLGHYKKFIMEHKPLRSVHSMPHIRAPTVRNVASETDIFSITGSGLYGQLSMTPEVPSISFAHLPKNYEDTPTVEKYKETMSLYKLQTANKERADSQIVDYSMPRYFMKTLAHSSHNLHDYNTDNNQNSLKRTQSKGDSKENLNNHHHHYGGHKKLEKSKRLKQLRGSLPPLIIAHRHHKKEDNKHAH